ncbi:Phospholipid scramblase family protein [Yarrowia sp. C11]|nr:Phospholipid scramblase family protein [Yarrowia sp. E02]KAG5372648.1 Phospholipid scramblase family protein [Yarrowia sp. C11]
MRARFRPVDTQDPNVNPNVVQPAYYNQVPNPGGVLTGADAITRMLSEPILVVERRMEMMNLILGFEQANKYVIMDGNGNQLGFMEEEDFGFVKALMRQVYRLHRPFKVNVYDNGGNHLMTISRKFSFINSKIKAILPASQGDGIIIGESQQQWHLWRRKYNLFQHHSNEEYDQFAAIDAPFLSFAFPARDREGAIMGAVDRNWVGLGREFFTDTGIYVLRMDPSAFLAVPEVGKVVGPMTLDERAVLLATAVSIDFDYFSRHSRSSGGLLSLGGGDYFDDN